MRRPGARIATTSCTWREFVLVKTLVNSGISAPATVPQLMMMESTHQRDAYFGSGRLPRSR